MTHVRCTEHVFAKQLANISFPDIDAAALRRQADELRSEAKTVARARAALDTALETFVTRLARLTETAARAVAYARIYSVAHPEQQALAVAISALSASAATTDSCMAVQGKRRGRPARRSAELFDATASASPHKDPA
jgi:phage-related tail protein